VNDLDDLESLRLTCAVLRTRVETQAETLRRVRRQADVLAYLLLAVTGLSAVASYGAYLLGELAGVRR
jgi:hypothetical protein